MVVKAIIVSLGDNRLSSFRCSTQVWSMECTDSVIGGLGLLCMMIFPCFKIIKSYCTGNRCFFECGLALFTRRLHLNSSFDANPIGFPCGVDGCAVVTVIHFIFSYKL